jgi:hypothetical protein
MLVIPITNLARFESLQRSTVTLTFTEQGE